MDKSDSDNLADSARRSMGEAHSPLSAAQIARCIDASVATAVEYITHNFPRFWDEWITSVQKREENARSNKEQLALAEVVKLLQQRATYIQRQYVSLIEQNFTDFSRQELTKPAGQERFSRNEGLSLVDNSELEETIAITSICHRADTQLADVLWALQQRLSLMNGGKKIDEKGNPVSPVQLCDALRRAMAELALDTRIKVLGYKHFEAALIKPLAEFYDELNRYLADENILPNLRFTAQRSAEANPGKTAEKSTADASDETSAPDSAQGAGQLPRRRATDRIFADSPHSDPAEYQQGLVSAIKLLQTHLGGSLAAQAGTAPPSGGRRAQDGNPAVAAAPLVGAVSVLQQQLAGQSQALADIPMTQVQPQSVSEVSARLVSELKQAGESNTRSDELHTIELVGLLFEYILSDEQLPDSVKALLSYLHTPVLKLAFIDKDFFENVDHPARILLNQMAEAGSRWVSNDGTSQYNIYEKIRTCVFQVLENFGNDVKVFAETSLDFSAFIRNVSRRQELMEKRALEKARGEEKLREAKILVNTQISRLIDGRDLPSPVLLLLLLPWSDYLSFIILRYGQDSEEFERALSVGQHLIWTIEPKLLEADKVRQLDVQDKLMAELQKGFDTIGYEQSKSRKLLDAIKSLQTLALKSQQAEPAPEPMRNKLESMAAEKAGTLNQQITQASAEESELIEKLKLIEFGTWLEDDKGKRLKVAWYNHKTMNYMLVDQQGRKVSMTSALQMARAMIAGNLRVIAGSAKPFFERALENIYHSLNARASAELLQQE
ncbi:DUF1631 family protein [Gilvimarinus xylanilyticus]|uniref:DUF1631 domain-containing protein n=1 Tax=Gilvimarinus xylanilyticus TaxID=2944139 RepID=A0A9X2HWM8_9GAMM|nr:DUF1631 family protein [Gilvimarinus xylanilyticus]MCP8899763.1 DUF1631 domain-containing protein [Gilvimarinus xylanilyticus]